MDLTDQRVSYDAERMEIGDMLDDPFAQFEQWFAEAEASGDPEPYAMVLSTVDVEGRPRGRNVLLRNVDDRGFVFYTNYESDKAVSIEATKVAGLTFRWFGVQRQVHVEGVVERIAAAESDDYFAKRPRESQLGAWASAQSRPIASRRELIDRLDEVTARFEGGAVPRPNFWGGYRVIPERIEFWQGQPSRLHDRIRYERASGEWQTVILSP